MKNPIVKLTAICLAAAVSTPLFAIDFEKIEEARQSAWSGLEAYNSAYKKIQSASSIIKNLFSMRDNAFRQSVSLEKRLKSQASALSEIKADAKVLLATFEKNKKFLDGVKGELKSASEAFKSEQKRFAYADEINAKLSDLSSKNPGKNYQDKRYADRLSAEYLDAKENFKNAQNELARLIVDADIANPRISGISSMLSLSYTFLKKAEDEVCVNAENLAALEGQTKLLEASSLENLKDLNICINKLRDVKMEFLSQYMDLLSAMGSQDKIFKANPNLKSISISPLSEMAGESADFKNREVVRLDERRYDPAQASASRKQKNGALSAGGADALGEQVSQENVRVEFLQIGKNLSDLTREIKEATMLMRAVSSEAESAIRGITRAEGSAKAVLQNAISISTEAQLLNSDIAIFKSELGVTSAQFEVSISNFKAILANFTGDCETCLEKSNQIKNILSED
ncbi:MAG: hypothetical protein IKO42_03760 [Opitutales bacterium]|nr:hypothetical protein [Opitutales bacterium]